MSKHNPSRVFNISFSTNILACDNRFYNKLPATFLAIISFNERVYKKVLQFTDWLAFLGLFIPAPDL